MLYNFQKGVQGDCFFDPHKYPVLEVSLVYLQFIHTQRKPTPERLKIHPRSHRKWQESEYSRGTRTPVTCRQSSKFSVMSCCITSSQQHPCNPRESQVNSLTITLRIKYCLIPPVTCHGFT